jgi:hypothetical protein
MNINDESYLGVRVQDRITFKSTISSTAALKMTSSDTSDLSTLRFRVRIIKSECGTCGGSTDPDYNVYDRWMKVFVIPKNVGCHVDLF